MTTRTTRDVEIGEINTRLEIIDESGKAAGNLKTIVETVLQRMRDGQAEQDMRNQDGRIRDRSWKSDVTPD
jgi:hypothetical protein